MLCCWVVLVNTTSHWLSTFIIFVTSKQRKSTAWNTTTLNEKRLAKCSSLCCVFTRDNNILHQINPCRHHRHRHRRHHSHRWLQRLLVLIPRFKSNYELPHSIYLIDMQHDSTVSRSISSLLMKTRHLALSRTLTFDWNYCIWYT